jgi:DNA-binding transcriptional regulator YdaS (Cro superfamily)
MNLPEFLSQPDMSQQKFADILGVTQSAVSQWLQWIADDKRGTRITAERALEIEKATDGAVTRHELRADVFGEPPKKAQAAA